MSDPEGDGPPDLDAYDKDWWDASIKRLIWHADSKLKHRRWRGVWGGPAPGGAQAVDIVQTACEKLVSRKRRWDPETHPDLFLWLGDQVDSEISNLVRSVDNKRGERLVPTRDGEDWTEQPMDPRDQSAGPEDLALSNEVESRANEFALGFIDHLAGKTDLLDVVDAVLSADGRSKPADWAARLNVPVAEIYGRQKRLRRELEKYMATMSVPSPRKGGTTRA